MREEEAKSAAAETADPWRLTLERVRGKVDFFDGLERVSSQTLLDLLEVPQRNAPRARFGVWRRDDRSGLDRRARAGSNEGRIQRAGSRVLPRCQEPGVSIGPAGGVFGNRAPKAGNHCAFGFAGGTALVLASPFFFFVFFFGAASAGA